MHLLGAFRWKNLLIVVLTLYGLRHVLWAPVLSENLMLGWQLFAALVLAVLCATAAGYLINDYYDQAIDATNRPDRPTFRSPADLRAGLWAYALLNAVGLLLCLWVDLARGYWCFVPLQLGVAALLWLYSKRLKRMAFWGNGLVASLCALVAVYVWLADREAIRLMSEPMAATVHLFFWGYVAFAWISNLFRELAKDLADREGDRRGGAKTLPIIWGRARCKNLLSVYAAIWFLLLAWAVFSLSALLPLWKVLVFFMFTWMPLASTVFQAFRASDRQGFLKSSAHAKTAMLLGLLYLPIIHL